jgi:hypothetical protein
MNRKTYTKKIHEIPENTGFLCPECQEGKLQILKKNVSLVEYDKQNKEAKSYEDFDFDWLKYAFHGFLECTNCHEKIVFSGKASPNCRYYNVDEGPEYYDELEIEYIERPPCIITINNEIPKEIKDILMESFKLYWIDINSCANKIRICLELMMDLFEIQKYKIRNKKRRTLSLHERISIFSRNNTLLEEILTSIKWIGNSASHNDKITTSDLLDGYYLLEYALEKIYNNNEKEIMKIAKVINKTKKPRSKNK